MKAIVIILALGVVGLPATAFYKFYYKPLDTCARLNNVYKCQWEALPGIKDMPKITDSEVEGIK